MPPIPEFPHLNLAFQGSFVPRFQGGRAESAEVGAIKANREDHAERIRRILGGMRQFDGDRREQRKDQGLPAVPADHGFLLRLPEGVDVEAVVRALGVELVAETQEGVMMVASEDLQFAKLEEVLRQFVAGEEGGGTGASLLDVYSQPDDVRRLRSILAPEVMPRWPFSDAMVYTFDLGIQTAASTRDVNWPKVKQRKGESDTDFQKRKEDARRTAWIAADSEWQENADARVFELQEFVHHYGGEVLSSVISDGGQETEAGIVFPDSVQIRIRMNGRGFRDVVLNFAHLFEVAIPPELQEPEGHLHGGVEQAELVVRSPAPGAATVCVVDSGIQENHRWLEPAMDAGSSRCFLPGLPSNDVADYFPPRGHGTRVAGAVLYPNSIPTSGEVEPVAWIQNARVLNQENKLPDKLLPEEYLERVVDHFCDFPRFTKIYNHSINSRSPCPTHRMTAWAAKLDELSHERDVLFIQSVGNQDRIGRGDQANPGLREHLEAGRNPPDHQFEASMRIANPGQSLHALSVGSVGAGVFEDPNTRSFAASQHGPSGFSRAGYGQPWSVVKPEVVEVGGDLVYSTQPPRIVRPEREVAIELLNSTLSGEPAFSKDGAGTSFAAPKVAHIAAHLQNVFPSASPLLYRALIVQSARWPQWAEAEPNKDRVLRLIGYGVPSVERATRNSATRVTLITPDAESLPSKQLHLYSVRIPEELRSAALEARIRVDVTLAYTSLPRRTRARRTGYLETWLDWEASRLGEPRDEFLARMEHGGSSVYRNIPWTLHTREDIGEVQETSRNRGSLQKDWAVFDSFDLPMEFAIAVRAHKGWNHLDGAGAARYCLAVSFEVVQGDVPIYSLVDNEIRAAEIEAEVSSSVFAGAVAGGVAAS